jgi:Ca2+-transporting ATPase
MASVLVQHPSGKLRLYNKGAAEMVLTRCTAMLDASGASVPMTEVRLWLWLCCDVCVV